jgi:hypothetical protein
MGFMPPWFDRTTMFLQVQPMCQKRSNCLQFGEHNSIEFKGRQANEKKALHSNNFAIHNGLVAEERNGPKLA